MKHLRLLPLLVIATICASPVLAADRLTDRDVKELVARVEEGRDRFDNALEDRLKETVLRGPSGETDVKRFLNDFQDSIDRVEERLKPEYAASAEVSTLLGQGSRINAFFRKQPAGTRGESEWNRLASDLKALANAYGTEFPLPENASVRRVGDGEVAEAADEVARSADQLKESLDTELKKDGTTAQQAREAIVDEADQLSKDAETLRDRVKDGEPSSGETERLLARAARLQKFIYSNKTPTSAKVWTGLTPQLQTVAGAYGVPWSTAR